MDNQYHDKKCLCVTCMKKDQAYFYAEEYFMCKQGGFIESGEIKKCALRLEIALNMTNDARTRAIVEKAYNKENNRRFYANVEHKL